MPSTFEPPKAQVAKVVKMYEKGEIGSVKAGEILGCTAFTAIRVLKAEGVTIRGRGRPKKQATK